VKSPNRTADAPNGTPPARNAADAKYDVDDRARQS
jgi:hypothetical protein